MAFAPEYIEADEVIQVDNEYYGIFNVSGPEYSLVGKCQRKIVCTCYELCRVTRPRR